MDVLSSHIATVSIRVLSYMAKRVKRAIKCLPWLVHHSRGPAHDSIVARFRTMSASVSEHCERTHQVLSLPCAPTARGRLQAVFPSTAEEQSYPCQNVSDIIDLTNTIVPRLP